MSASKQAAASFVGHLLRAAQDRHDDDFARGLRHCPPALICEPYCQIAEKIIEMHAAGMRPDEVMLYKALPDHLKAIGPLETAVSSANIDFHAEQCRNAYYRLCLERLPAEIKDLIADGCGPDEALQIVRKRIEDVLTVAGAGGTTLKEVARTVVERSREKTRSVPSLRSVDAYIGGIGGGELALIGARPSVGKSSLVQTMQGEQARAGYRSVLFTLEMSAEEISTRWLSENSGMIYKQISAGDLDEEKHDRLVKAHDNLPDGVFVDDSVYDIAELEVAARYYRYTEGVDIVYVDYVSLLDNRRMSYASRYERVSDTSKRLKRLAKTLNIPIVAVQQLNRESSKQGRVGANDEMIRPQLAHLRDSGSLEQDCDIALMLYRDSDNPTLVRVAIEKCRNGARSAKGSDPALRFDAQIFHMS